MLGRRRVSASIQFGACEDLSQSHRSEPKTEANQGMAASQVAAVAESIAPTILRNLVRICVGIITNENTLKGLPLQYSTSRLKVGSLGQRNETIRRRVIEHPNLPLERFLIDHPQRLASDSPPKDWMEPRREPC